MTGSKQRLLDSIDVQGLLNRRTVECEDSFLYHCCQSKRRQQMVNLAM
jgi:hypothetical protein